MQDDITPTYILLLFAFVSVLLIYVVFHWIWSVLSKKLLSNMNIINTDTNIEGFANQKYTYKPNSNSPNLFITFGLSDLAIDISAACGFIKVDSKLIRNISERGTNSAPATRAQSEVRSENGDKKESFVDEPQDSTTERPYSTQPLYPIASQIETSDADYTVPYTDLQIYKMYNTATGYSSTSNANIYKMMDETYGKLFDSSQLGEMTDAGIDKLWNSIPANRIDNAIYTGTTFFVIQSEMSNRQCTQLGLSEYFVSQIKKNKTRSSSLLSLKNAYYAIIKPRFLINTLTNIYWENAKLLTNSDKGTFNSIIFVLNTCASLATTNTLEPDLTEQNVAKIVSDDTNFTMDSLRLYQMMSVAFELYRFVADFEKKGTVTSGNGTPAITTNLDKFIVGFPKYLQKTNQIATDSPLVFLAQHLPYDNKCEIISKLAT